MTILKRLWSVLLALGPAPVAEGGKKEGPKSLEASDRGMFDDPEGEEQDEQGGEEEEPRRGNRSEREEDTGGDDRQEEREEDEGGDEHEDDDGDDRTRSQADDDRDEDEDDDADDDSQADDGGEEDDTALSLRETWETRLEADARANPDAPARLNLDGTALREAARAKFDELRDKDPDGKFDADAMFTVAMDAALQVVGAYHSGVASPSGERIEKGLRNVQVGRSLTSFRREVRKVTGANIVPAVEQKMADLYNGFATKYGWRRADKVPLKTLFRMAGGSLKKGAKPEGKKPDANDDRAESQKRAALGAARGPRPLGRTRADDGAGKPRKEDRALREFHEDVKAHRPFFTLEV